MGFVTISVKLLIILVFALLPTIPLFAEYLNFKKDKESRIGHKRFCLIIFSVIYVTALTIFLLIQQNILGWISSLGFIQWLTVKLSVSDRFVYCSHVFAAIAANLFIGLSYRFIQRFIRIGLKKKKVSVPAKKSGEFSLLQRIERSILFFFNREFFFFVGRVIKGIALGLTITYPVLFILFQLPAFFSAEWIPYGVLAMVFDAGNVLYIMTLLVLWEVAFFLEGVSLLEKECPELFDNKDFSCPEEEIDLEQIDRACKKEYKDFFAGDFNIDKEGNTESVKDKSDVETKSVKRASSPDPTLKEDNSISNSIVKAIENDERMPGNNVELYKKCIDQLIQKEDTSFIVNGNFFGEFSLYFFRYLSMIVARGDNIAIICNSINEVETVYSFVTDAFSKISSLYTRNSKKNIDFDDPIWKIHKITRSDDLTQRTQMQDASIIITTLPFLCSKEFEYFSGSFIQLLNTVIFVCALDTVNIYPDQLSAMNQCFINIIENNSRKSKSNEYNPGFRIRYKSMPIRYIAFDDSKIPGLDKAFKNLLSISFESVDIMVDNSKAIVRLYNNEPVPDENGNHVFPNILHTTEQLGTVVNMAVTAVKAGARHIFIYENGSVPFRNYKESLDSNMGKVQELYGDVSILINDYSYTNNDKAVVIVFDEKCNLPETIRRYLSLFGNDEILIMIFSKKYLYRDYYNDNIEKLYQGCQYSRIPFYEGTFRDIARKILLKADSGGITVKEIFNLCFSIPQFRDDIAKNDVNSILRKVLEEFGVCQDDYVDIYEYFEYSYSKDFDEHGIFDPIDKIALRHTGQYYDIVNGLDCARLVINNKSYDLPISNRRISQNYIEGQNMIYEGNIYKIDMINPGKGEITARLASGGNNDETVDYIQDREYIAYLSAEELTVEKSKHIIIRHNDSAENTKEKDIRIDDIYLNVISFPMEVITKGYYMVDPNTMSLNHKQTRYVSIFEGINEKICKQTYRKYGFIEEPFYSTDDIVSEAELNASVRQAHALMLKLRGNFGENSDRLTSLAGVMMNETLKMIFPSVADCIAVCPIYRNKHTIESEGNGVLDFYPKLTIKGDREYETNEIEILIIEDCSYDVGLIFSLTESGDDVLNTIFKPIRDYLEWLKNSVDGSQYLCFGNNDLPKCFDTDALLSLSTAITESNIVFNSMISEQIDETEVCDFCRRKVPKSINNVIEGKDGRIMCSKCRKNIVGNNKKVLSELVEKARTFIESTYNISIDPKNQICFESTDKIESMIKKGKDQHNCGNDLPLMSFIDGNNTIYIEYEIPALNIQELIIRELVQFWQISEVPNADNELAEGHIAFVTIQFLSFAGNKNLYKSMLNYYESTKNVSGIGYRKLLRKLITSDKYRDNPFYLLMSDDGHEVNIPKRKIAREGDYGNPYIPNVFDRCSPGELRYYYYDHIPERLKPCYDTLIEAIKAHQKEVDINGFNVDDVNNAISAVKCDHPELFWFNRIIEYRSIGDTLTAVLDYGMNKEETVTLQKHIDEAVKPFLEGITSEMSAYDVLIRLHVKMINHIDYDTIGLEHQDKNGGPKDGEIDSLRSIIGTLLDGKAVCAGYAKTMQYLANLCGIECTYCRGYCYGHSNKKDEYHAWNVVKLDGEYYHLDTTWCDRSDTVQAVKNTEIGFRYFCITTEEICRSRSIDKEPVNFPDFKSLRCNYYIHNGLYLESYDIKKIIAMAEHIVRNGKNFLEFKCASESVYNDAMDKLFKAGSDVWEVTKAVRNIDKTIGSGCTYTYDEKIFTIRIYFKSCGNTD